MKIVSISGTEGVGKDTAGVLTTAALRAEGIDARTFSFAAEGYIEVAQAFELTVEYLQRRETKELDQERLSLAFCRNPEFVNFMLTNAQEITGSRMDLSTKMSPRNLLKWYLTQYRRQSEFGYDEYWIDKTHSKLKRHPDALWFCTDTRFDAERAFLGTHDTLYVRLHKDNVDDKDEYFLANGHESEKQWRKWLFDVHVMNLEGNEADLIKSMKDAIHCAGKGYFLENQPVKSLSVQP